MHTWNRTTIQHVTLNTKRTPNPKRRHKDVHMTACKKNIAKVLKCSNISCIYNCNYTSN